MPESTSKLPRNIGILWDLDGVLVDTGESHYQAWAETCARYSIPFSREAFRQTFGMNNVKIVGTLTGRVVAPELVAEISDYKEQLFRRTIRGRVQLLRGVKLWLERFQTAGFPQAVASSAPQANIDAIVDELGIRLCFAALVSGAEMPGKPDPAVFLEASRHIGIAPQRCLVIEDSVAGVEAGLAAGMTVVAITNSLPPEKLARASKVVRSVKEIEQWLL